MKRFVGGLLVASLVIVRAGPGAAEAIPGALEGPFTVHLAGRTFLPPPGVTLSTDTGVRHVLVQPVDPNDAGWRSRAEAEGLRILDYVPRNTWVAALPPKGMAASRIFGEFRWVGALSANDRIAPGLNVSGPGAWAIERDGRIRLQVSFFGDVNDARAREILTSEGAGILVDGAGVLHRWTVRAPVAAIDRLSLHDEVRWIVEAPPVPVELNDGVRANMHADIVASDPYFLDGNGMRIGLWDTGDVDATHGDLAGRVTLVESAAVSGHSTHVAGTLAGNGSGSLSHGGVVNQWKGVAPQAGIWNYTYFDNPVGEHDTAINLYSIDLSQNSWGFLIGGDTGTCGYYGKYVWEAPEYDAIVTGLYGRKIPVIFAVGNERDDGDCGIPARGGYACIAPPATAKNVITVGAIESNDDTMTPFSSWGPTFDGRIRPDIVAPGCQSTGDLGIKSTEPGGSYGTRCGTSMAAPAASGAIALILEEWKQLYPAAPAPLPSSIKALVIEGARDLGNAGPDFAFGFGALDARKAVDILRTQSVIEDVVAATETRDIPFFVPPGTSELRIALAWDDPAAIDGADPALVNDLDLRLIDPSLAERLPLVLNPAAPSTPAVPGNDARNNVEEVVIAAPPSGTWICRVSGTAVPVGPQAFSVLGLDQRPPAAVSGLALEAVGDSTIELRWSNPEDLDFAGTLVLRSESPIVWQPAAALTYTPGTEVAPGVIVIAVDALDHSIAPVVDNGRPTGIIEHYRLFTLDQPRNYDAGYEGSLTVGSPIPVLLSTAPEASALAVPAGANVSVSFNMAMDIATLDSTTFRVTGSVSGVHGGALSLSSGGREADLDPASSFAPGEQVDVVLSTGVRSEAGYALAEGRSFRFFVAAAGAGVGEFAKVQEPATGNSPTDVRLTDVDGDGDADGLVVNRISGTLRLLRNEGGMLIADSSYAIGAGSGHLATGDLDRDGLTDAVVSLGPGNAISVMRNGGAGLFAPDSAYTLSDAAGGIVVTDLDMDGWPDVVATLEGSAVVQILRNVGGGTLAPQGTLSVLLGPHGIQAGDVDGDGDPDLVVLCSTGNSVRTYLNLGNGSFTPGWAGTVLGRPNEGVLADLDGDHDLDLALSRRLSGAVDILWNEGHGNFGALSVSSFAVGSIPWSVVALDADEDGDLDLGVTLNGASAFGLLRNQAPGSFGGFTSWTVGTHPLGIAAADISGDGDMDILAALSDAGTAAVLDNLNATSSVGDGTGTPEPVAFALQGSRANPFRRGEAVIGFSLDRDRAVSLILYDVTGREVRRLVDGVRMSGFHESRWDGRDTEGRLVSPGIYFLRLTSGRDVASRKLVIAP